jgi:alpha-1,2-mannosyltransferase
VPNLSTSPIRDDPAFGALALLVLVAIAVGILQGYAELGRRTITRHGMEDFGLFHASARQFLEGGTLYGPLRRPGFTRLSDARNLNPPHATLLFVPFAVLSPGLALQAWILLNLLALCDVVRVLMRELRLPLMSLRTAMAAVFLLAWAPTAALVITGQLALVVAWPLTRAWRAARHGKWNRAGIWLGGAAALKIFLLVFVPYLALRGRWPALRRAIQQFAACVVFGALVCGPSAYVEWAAQFNDVTWYGHDMNASVWGLLARVLNGFAGYAPLLPAARLGMILGWLSAATILCLTWRRAATVREENVDASFTLLTAAALLASPLGWVYYFWLPIAPAAATIAAAARSWSWAHRVAAGALALGMLWHGSATVWFQPSGLATLTVGSPYLWSLFGVWLWLLIGNHPSLPSGARVSGIASS